MLGDVRTTVRLDDDLYREIKATAARSGRPVGEVIADALRAFVAGQRSSERPLAELPVWHGDGLLPGVDASSNAALRAAMDEGVPLDASR
jgi:Ribbon-helix-helix protein, copG family